MNLQTKFGETLKATRLKQKLSQSDLASQTWISKIENGEINLTLSSLELLAGKLGKKVSIRFTGNKKSNGQKT